MGVRKGALVAQGLVHLEELAKECNRWCQHELVVWSKVMEVMSWSESTSFKVPKWSRTPWSKMERIVQLV